MFGCLFNHSTLASPLKFYGTLRCSSVRCFVVSRIFFTTLLMFAHLFSLFAHNQFSLVTNLRVTLVPFSRSPFVPCLLCWPAKDLIKKLMTVDPLKRITIEGVVGHPWTGIHGNVQNTLEGVQINPPRNLEQASF